jgi:hypothetical protein
VPAPNPPAGDSWARRDWRVLAWLVGVPAFLLSVAAAAGYPLITGDDLIQNYPLGQLTGRVLRAGHLPLWDPYLWSGTPLLGGTIAHSFLPTTLLFAVLPPVAAWVVGEVVVVGLAATGVQLFLRRTGCSTLAAGLGGAAFGLGGFESSQLVHIDFAAAAAALPWIAVSLDGLARRAVSSRYRHCLLLAAAVAWLALAGSPDIVIDAVVVIVCFSIHLLLPGRRLGTATPVTAGGDVPTPPQPSALETATPVTAGGDVPTLDRRGRLAFLGWAATGGLIGLALGALQWLPAAAFVAASQRAHPSLAFISGGSLSPANFLELLVPHLLGGGSFGNRVFAGSFPLAEVDAYPGTLALVAIFALLAGWRRPGADRWRVWLVVAAASLVVVSGDHTPLERLLAHLPITGSERLPGRALILFALASATLLGYFIDQLRLAGFTRLQKAAGSLPLAGIVTLEVVTLVTGRPAGGALTAHDHAWSAHGEIGYFLVGAALVVAAGVLVFRRGSLGRRSLALGAAILVIVDLAVFSANQSSLVPTHVASLSPAHAQALQALIGEHRYLVIDPSLKDGAALEAVGAPDLGVAADLPAADGYGSLVWGPYDAATGTHQQDAALPKAFTDGTFRSLGVSVVLVQPSALTQPLATALSGGGWSRRGARWGFDVFENPAVSPPLALRRTGSLSVVAEDDFTGSLTVRVDSASANTLVRAVADVPGWHVTVTSGRRARTQGPPLRAGVVQAVLVPAGVSTVTFSYQPPGWAAAQGLAAAGVIAVVALLGWATIAARRRRGSGGPERLPDQG